MNKTAIITNIDTILGLLELPSAYFEGAARHTDSEVIRECRERTVFAKAYLSCMKEDLENADDTRNTKTD